MKTIAAIALMLGIATPAVAQTPQWVQLATGDGNYSAYDQGSIQRTGGSVVVRVAWVPPTPTEDGVARMESTFIYDCRARTVDMTTIKAFDASGAVMFDEYVPSEDRQIDAIAADSPNELIANAVCA